jgi:hypothetical protein
MIEVGAILLPFKKTLQTAISNFLSLSLKVKGIFDIVGFFIFFYNLIGRLRMPKKSPKILVFF